MKTENKTSVDIAILHNELKNINEKLDRGFLTKVDYYNWTITMIVTGLAVLGGFGFIMNGWFTNSVRTIVAEEFDSSFRKEVAIIVENILDKKEFEIYQN